MLRLGQQPIFRSAGRPVCFRPRGAEPSGDSRRCGSVPYHPSFASWRYAMKRFALIALLAAVAGGGFLIRRRSRQDV